MILLFQPHISQFSLDGHFQACYVFDLACGSLASFTKYT